MAASMCELMPLTFSMDSVRVDVPLKAGVQSCTGLWWGWGSRVSVRAWAALGIALRLLGLAEAT